LLVARLIISVFMAESGMATIPLFPLGTVLFPDGYLPLRIFEVRYLDLIQKCFTTGAEFGVVALNWGHEIQVAGQHEQFAEIGTMARILEMTPVQANLLNVRTIGGTRFRILSSERQKNGVWQAEIENVAPDQEVAIPPELDDTARALGHLIAALQQEGITAPHFPLLPPFRLDDCGWVSNRWCDLLPLTLEEKQRLLTLDNPLLRLELVQDLLDERGWLE
jgi:Lon protease-like protein